MVPPYSGVTLRQSGVEREKGANAEERAFALARRTQGEWKSDTANKRALREALRRCRCSGSWCAEARPGPVTLPSPELLPHLQRDGRATVGGTHRKSEHEGVSGTYVGAPAMCLVTADVSTAVHAVLHTAIRRRGYTRVTAVCTIHAGL